METLLLFLAIIVLLLIGVPIAIALGFSSVVYLILVSDTRLATVAQTLFTAFEENATLLAIPFFILASSFMSTGGVAERIIRFSIACVGHFRGGLAIAGVFACMMFAALSGSSAATVVAIGTIVIAAMRKVGYRKEFAAGVICNAGTLGILIPPSIIMLVYAASVGVSPGRMFLAGVVPGLMAGLMLMIGIYLYARAKDMPAQPFAGIGEILSSGLNAFWGLFLIVIILGGIYGGVFTPTEAAAVAAVYAFLVANFVYRDMGPLKTKRLLDDEQEERLAFLDSDEDKSGQTVVADRIAIAGSMFARGLTQAVLYFPATLAHADTRKALYEAGKLTIILLFIIANALILKQVLTQQQVPQEIARAIIDAGFGPVAFLIVLNVVLLIGGQFMEPSGLIVIVAPLVFPIAMKLGIDPIHLGIIMVVNMEIGMVTPPVGLNLFVTSGVAGMPMMDVVKAAAPMLGILFIFLIIVTYVPEISTWLPDLAMGAQGVTR